MLRVLASFERACNDALASLARVRKLEDCFALLGQFETKKEGWRDEVRVGVCCRWLANDDRLGVIIELALVFCVEAALFLLVEIVLSSFCRCRWASSSRTWLINFVMKGDIESKASIESFWISLSSFSAFTSVFVS